MGGRGDHDQIGCRRQILNGAITFFAEYAAVLGVDRVQNTFMHTLVAVAAHVFEHKATERAVAFGSAYHGHATRRQKVMKIVGRHRNSMHAIACSQMTGRRTCGYRVIAFT